MMKCTTYLVQLMFASRLAAIAEWKCSRSSLILMNIHLGLLSLFEEGLTNWSLLHIAFRFVSFDLILSQLVLWSSNTTITSGTTSCHTMLYFRNLISIRIKCRQRGI